MPNAIRTMLAIAAVSASVFVTSPSSQASDARPCVSRREFNLVYQVQPTLSRTQLEHRWEVAGKGFRNDEYAGRGQYGWVYPACGFGMGDVQVIAIYDEGTGRLAAAGRVNNGNGARPHGHPRTN